MTWLYRWLSGLRLKNNKNAAGWLLGICIASIVTTTMSLLSATDITTAQLSDCTISSSHNTHSIQRYQPKYYNLSDSLDGIQPRAFAWKTKTGAPLPIPCYEPNDTQWKETASHPDHLKEGFFFHKPVKTGGSTVAGVHLRIAFHEAQRRRKNYTRCASRFEHPYRDAEDSYGDRIRERSFLWSVFREPTSRVISAFFHFHVSRNKVEPRDADFQRIARQIATKDKHYTEFSAPQIRNGSLALMGNGVLGDYDFIGVTERMDESLVLLSMILDIPLEDVLYVSAKSNGGFDDGRFHRQCFYIVPTFVTPGMREFFESKEWQDLIYSELQVYRAVNASLDITIKAVGKSKFEKRLRTYRQLKELVTSKCLPTIQYPCDTGGELHANGSHLTETPCLYSDSGCGYDCIDRILLSKNR